MQKLFIIHLKRNGNPFLNPSKYLSQTCFVSKMVIHSLTNWCSKPKSVDFTMPFHKLRLLLFQHNCYFEQMNVFRFRIYIKPTMYDSEDKIKNGVPEPRVNLLFVMNSQLDWLEMFYWELHSWCVIMNRYWYCWLFENYRIKMLITIDLVYK